MNLFSGKLKDFSAIYSDFYPVIYNSIYLKIGNADTAGDLAQEVFTRLLEKIDEVENARTWLHGAMKLVVFEYYRRKNANIDIDEVFDDVNMRYVNGFRETRIIIQDALEAPANYGDEKEKIIFDLVALKDYTFKETAEQIGLSERQVRYRYNAVSKNIINYLHKRGIKGLEELL